MLGRRGDSPRKIFTTMKNAKMNDPCDRKQPAARNRPVADQQGLLGGFVDRQALVEIEREPGIRILGIELPEVKGPDVGHATISSICSTYRRAVTLAQVTMRFAVASSGRTRRSISSNSCICSASFSP